jgi:predicted amidohydrolase
MDELLENVKKLAREKDMYIALGLIRQDKGKRYNSVCLISPEGCIRGSYDKRALWGWDLNHFERGTQSGIFDVDGVKTGFRICFEVRFPEYFRELFKEQAELCFVLFSDVAEQASPLRYEIIKSHLITRAVENVMTVVSVNSISDFQTAPTAVFDINGNSVFEAPENKEFLLVYDYVKPEIGYGAKGRIENSKEAMNITTL